MKLYVVDTQTEREIPKSCWERFKAKVRKTGTKVKNWCVNHKTELITASPVIFATGRWIGKTIHRSAVVNKKEKLMKYSVYDRSENHHWFLKRELTNREWREIKDRRSKGERLGDILEKMKVLK